MKKTGIKDNEAEERLGGRAERADPTESESIKEELIGPKLPFSPPQVWVMPNALARSALFGVIRRGPRRVFNQEVINCRRDEAILMSGPQLDQADADTWMQLMRIAKSCPLGSRIYFNRFEVLKAMQRGSGQSQYYWLDQSIDRLHQASISISNKAQRYKTSFQLIKNTGFDQETGKYWIQIDSEIANLFERHRVCYLDTEKRYKLGKNDLAKWLHTYATSHSQGATHTIGVEYLHNWCGSKGRLRAFRTALIKALAALEAAVIVSGAHIRHDDKVTWFRPHSESTAEPLVQSESEINKVLGGNTMEVLSA
jgi:hypothetical protein